MSARLTIRLPESVSYLRIVRECLQNSICARFSTYLSACLPAHALFSMRRNDPQIASRDLIIAKALAGKLIWMLDQPPLLSGHALA